MFSSLIKGIYSAVSVFCISIVIVHYFKLDNSITDILSISIAGVIGIIVALKDYTSKPMVATAYTPDNWKTIKVKEVRQKN